MKESTHVKLFLHAVGIILSLLCNNAAPLGIIIVIFIWMEEK